MHTKALFALLMALCLCGCDDFNWHDDVADGDIDVTGDGDSGDADQVTDGDVSSTERDIDADLPDGDADNDAVIDGDSEFDGAPDGDSPGDDEIETDSSDFDSVEGDTENKTGDGDAADEETDSDWTPEFVCADGVCTDVATDLEWQLNGAANSMTLDAAVSYCANLETDGGGWRLPNISELRTLVRNCPAIQTGGSCGVMDVCPPCGVDSGERCLTATVCQGLNCSPSACANDGGANGCYWSPEIGGNCSWFWSSSSETLATCAFVVDFMKGEVDCNIKTSSNGYARCVR